jgi:hypothetical protein
MSRELLVGDLKIVVFFTAFSLVNAMILLPFGSFALGASFAVCAGALACLSCVMYACLKCDDCCNPVK